MSEETDNVPEEVKALIRMHTEAFLTAIVRLPGVNAARVILNPGLPDEQTAEFGLDDEMIAKKADAAAIAMKAMKEAQSPIVRASAVDLERLGDFTGQKQ